MALCMANLIKQNRKGKEIGRLSLPRLGSLGHKRKKREEIKINIKSRRKRRRRKRRKKKEKKFKED